MRASMREIARRSSPPVDDKTVALCIAKAGLTHGRGGFDLDEALQAVRDHADLLRAAGHDAAQHADASPGSTAREQLAAANIVTVELKNDLLRIEAERKRGELVERKAVEATALEIIANAKAALLALKYKLAPAVALETDVAKLQKLIGDEIARALGDVADVDKFTEAILR